MLLILGILIVFSCVVGGFLLEEGQLLALWQPNELLIIGGAAFGSFIISNPIRVIKDTVRELFKLLFGRKYNKIFFLDLFSLLFALGTKIRRNGWLSIEEDIEEPLSSPLFGSHPNVIANRQLMDFITDNMRVICSGHLINHELENLLDNEIELLEEELEKPAVAIGVVADAFPGFGIIAAVLGIVITMQSLGGEPDALGLKVAAALVGTFLGVLLSYGFVGPIGMAVGNQAQKEIKVYHCVKIFLLAFIAGTAPKMAVEYARRSLYSEIRPRFLELEEHIKSW